MMSTIVVCNVTVILVLVAFQIQNNRRFKRVDQINQALVQSSNDNLQVLAEKLKNEELHLELNYQSNQSVMQIHGILSSLVKEIEMLRTEGYSPDAATNDLPARFRELEGDEGIDD